MANQVPIDIKVTKHGDVAVLQMFGTDNRLNTVFCKKWIDALDKVESWPDVKALVSTGTGKFYSNGLDLNFLLAASVEEAADFNASFKELRRRILCFPTVTIAAINGHCFAGAVLLAFMHDYRVMHNGKGWICLNEIDLGTPFPDPMTELFKVKFSPRMIREAAIYGKRFTAEQALDIGLIDKIAPEGGALSEAVEMAINETEGRTYSRDILRKMKTDMYRDIIDTGDIFPEQAVKKSLTRGHVAKL